MIKKFYLYSLSFLFFTTISVNTFGENLLSQWQPIDPPKPKLDSMWLVRDYLEENKLQYHMLFNIDFSEDGTVWVASDQGVYRYDGYQWTLFTQNDGLLSNFVRCVLVDQNNRVWVGTDKGVCTFDGKQFQTLQSQEVLDGYSIRRIREDSNGTIWFCGDLWPDPDTPGGLVSFHNNQWTYYTVEDGLPSNHVMDYFRDSQGRQFALTARGAAIFIENRWVNLFKVAGLNDWDQVIWDIVETPEKEIYFSTKDMIYRWFEDTWTTYPLQAGQPPRFCLTSEGKIISCYHISEGQRAFLEWGEDQFHQRSYPFDSLLGDVESIRQAPDGSIWAIGYNCLTRWDLKEQKWLEFNSLPPPKMIDRHNRVWFVGDKTIVKDENQWYHNKSNHINYCLDANRDAWSWSKDDICRYTHDSFNRYLPETFGMHEIHELIADGSGPMWAYGINRQNQITLAMWDGQTWSPCDSSFLQNSKIIMGQTDPNGGIWLVVHHPLTNEYKILPLPLNEDKSVLLDKDIISKLEAQVQVNLYIDQNQNIWFYGEGLLCVFRHGFNAPNIWDHIRLVNNRHVFSVISRDDGEWVAMCPQGIINGGIAKLHPYRDGWDFFPFDTRKFGFKSDDGTIMVGGHERIYLIPPGWNKTPFDFPLPKMTEVRHVVKHPSGALWIAINHSVLHYCPDNIPPETFLSSKIQRIVEGDTLYIQCVARNKYVPSTDYRKFLYSWRMDQGEWTDFQTISSDSLVLSGLGQGRHEIEVKAMDEDFEIDPTPATLTFYVYPSSFIDSFWFKTLIIIIIFMLLSFALFAIHARQKMLVYANNLESMVEERTQELQQSNLKYQQLIENANSIILRMSTTHKILFFNEYAESLFGYSGEEIIGQDVVGTIVPPEESTGRDLRELFDQICGDPAQFHYVECEGILKSGKRIWIAWSNRVVVSNNSNQPEVLCVGSNITEHKMLEEQLRHSQKQEAVGQLARGVAHNLNNLLTGIIGNISLVVSRVDEKVKKRLDQAFDSANRAAELVGQLQTFSRRSRLQSTTVDINQILEGVINLCREIFDPQIKLSKDLQNPLPQIEGDVPLIQTALMNFCINSHEAITRIQAEQKADQRHNTEYTIEIKSKLEHIDEKYVKDHPWAASGQFVVVIIEDNGIGIKKEDQEHIFEPFFTTKHSVGAGMGLASAFGIIKQHKGWIDFQTESGKGSTFEIYLPALQS